MCAAFCAGSGAARALADAPGVLAVSRRSSSSLGSPSPAPRRLRIASIDSASGGPHGDLSGGGSRAPLPPPGPPAVFGDQLALPRSLRACSRRCQPFRLADYMCASPSKAHHMIGAPTVCSRHHLSRGWWRPRRRRTCVAASQQNTPLACAARLGTRSPRALKVKPRALDCSKFKPCKHRHPSHNTQIAHHMLAAYTLDHRVRYTHSTTKNDDDARHHRDRDL